MFPRPLHRPTKRDELVLLYGVRARRGQRDHVKTEFVSVKQCYLIVMGVPLIPNDNPVKPLANILIKFA